MTYLQIESELSITKLLRLLSTTKAVFSFENEIYFAVNDFIFQQL